MNGSRRGAWFVAGAFGLALGVAACGTESGLGPDGTEPVVVVRFVTAAPGTSAAAAPVRGRNGLAPAAAGVAAGDLAIEGSNGTLTLTDVRLVVAEFELERADDGDCDSSGEGNPCDEFEDEFELAPYFLDLPLTGEAAVVGSDQVPEGTYEEIEFEVEDLEVEDDDDADKATQIRDLFESIRSEFADWPDSASMLVTGTFTPTDGDPVPFRVYVDAEIEIELEFEPPVTLSAADIDREVTIHVDPGAWFRDATGRVLDLSAFDYDATGRLFEFEAEFELDHGFEIEHGDD
ncbi:MAG TPA: hypothetical protein VF188_08100 [Longimicrobiales bacterium]